MKNILDFNSGEVARKNLADFYRTFSRHHRAWLRHLKSVFLKNDSFDIHQFILSDRYANPKDKEIATFVSLLIRADDVDGIVEQTDILYDVIGEEPFLFVMKGKYASLSLPCVADERLFSNVTNRDVAIILANVYNMYSIYGGTENFYDRMTHGEEAMRTFADYLLSDYSLKKDVKVRNEAYMIPLMFIRLMNSNGLGIGLWSGKKCDVCPRNADVLTFIDTFFYHRCKRFSTEEKIEMMGFKSGSDFFYAYLAYKRLMGIRPSECRRYATLFRRRLENRSDTEKYRGADMESILPPIE